MKFRFLDLEGTRAAFKHVERPAVASAERVDDDSDWLGNLVFDSFEGFHFHVSRAQREDERILASLNFCELAFFRGDGRVRFDPMNWKSFGSRQIVSGVDVFDDRFADFRLQKFLSSSEIMSQAEGDPESEAGEMAQPTRHPVTL